MERTRSSPRATTTSGEVASRVRAGIPPRVFRDPFINVIS
jgi:hypothetical protein